MRTLADDDIAGISSLKFTPNGKFIIASALDCKIRLWELGLKGSPNQIVRIYTGHVCGRTCSPVQLFTDPRKQVSDTFLRPTSLAEVRMEESWFGIPARGVLSQMLFVMSIGHLRVKSSICR